MNVLIVDDQEINLRLLRAQLEGEGHRVLTAVDGVDALEVLEREAVDAVISDIFMPRMDGYRLCRRLRQHERLSELPFILYSATCKSMDDRKLGFFVGADNFLCKPAPFEALNAALQDSLTRPKRDFKEARPLDKKLDLLQHYSEGLVAKLEEKSGDLRCVIEERDAEIVRRKAAEESLRELNLSLEERVRERTAELEASNKELEAFSYSVSHDLRAPLRAIDGYSQVLVEDYNDRLDEDGRRVLSVVRSEARRMGRLIDELLDFSRVGRQIMEPRETDMRALAETSFAEASALEPDRKIAVEIAALPVAHGEPVMLRQVWANLLMNAVKFTRHRADAKIEVGATRADGGTIYFVRDNGAGFDMAHAGKLFGVFQRLHGEAEYEGTGVGLAFVKRILQRHGGRIWAEGAIDQGATFYFALPELIKAQATP